MLNKAPSKSCLKVSVKSTYADYVPDFYWTHPCSNPNVKEALAPEVAHWSPENPILITAGTGMGKTTFVFEVLIPLILESGKNLLLISNRVALSTQQKEGVMKILNHKFQGRLPADVLREWTDFGQVRVITYHQLPSFVKAKENQEWIANLQYVVADEIHYCTSDSSFNSWAGQHLYILANKFKHTIRCYMTATEWDILAPLAEAEKKAFPTREMKAMSVLNHTMLPDHYFIRYVFEPNYEYVNLNFFDDWKEIYQLIEKNPDDKFLIFVDNKFKGAEIAKKLGNKATYIDADSKETAAWNKIVSEETFDTPVLIATAVLDCGLNLNDDKIHHAIICSDNRTQLIQMLGRKRRNRKKPDEKLNLYVKRLSSQKLNRRLMQAYEINELANRFEQTETGDKKVGRQMRDKLTALLWNHPDAAMRTYFTKWDDGDLHMNKIAIFTLRRRINFWEGLTDPEADFEKAVCTWLGKGERPKTAVSLLTEFCCDHEGQPLLESDMATLRQFAANAAKECGEKEEHPERIKSYTRTKINRILTLAKCQHRLDNDNELSLYFGEVD